MFSTAASIVFGWPRRCIGELSEPVRWSRHHTSDERARFVLPRTVLQSFPRAGTIKQRPHIAPCTRPQRMKSAPPQPSTRPHRQPGTFGVGTLCLALVTISLAFGMLTWTTIRPLVLPLALAIPLYWFGAICMSLSERRFAGYRPVLLIGCVAMSTSVLIGFVGTLFTVGLSLISLIAK